MLDKLRSGGQKASIDNAQVMHFRVRSIAVGDLMWVDTTEEGREPCADALYLVMSQAGQPFIRRAVVDHRKTTWLASDHYNQRIHKAFRWKVARVVGRLNKLSVVMQAARQQLEERHEQGKKRKR